MTRPQCGVPIIIQDLVQSESAEQLTRIHLSRKDAGDDRYDEKWIQQLIMDHPAVLPIEDLEAAFVSAVPICTELPTPSGYADNLFVTPDGGLILVECKL